MRRAVPATPSELLPLQLETIGIQYDQEPVTRPHGYPCYHWLQTLAGEGELSMNGRTWNMPERSGILLAPGTPHHYKPRSDSWQTGYITFHGSTAGNIVQSLGWSIIEHFQWGAGHDPITGQMKSLLAFAESGGDPSGWRYSADLYRFLTLLRTEARTDKRPPISKQTRSSPRLASLARTRIRQSRNRIGGDGGTARHRETATERTLSRSIRPDRIRLLDPIKAPQSKRMASFPS
jgi:AraC family transcriptional regulator, arabinose operon regulatory protein